MDLTEFIWMMVGFVLTLVIFSYLLGDNVLFRLGSYLFVGVTAGYVATVVIYQVLWPRIVIPLVNGTASEKLIAAVPLLLGILLLFKLSPRLSSVGSVPMGYLVGIGAALTITGAVFGTIFGQVNGAISSFDLQNGTGQTTGGPVFKLLEALLILIGTITTLVYFNFTGRAKSGEEPQRPHWMEGLSKIGQVFIAITFGALYAGVFLASIAALVNRLDFIKDVVQQLAAL
ncbi:MAG: hypothetical protein LLG42_05355 [Chloroflexi bacterium]|nr:hypothetical protein [Chloroflexota bacterium]